MKFYLLTLGCPKNVADSEGVAMVMKQSGYRATDDPAKADVLIVNTCGFLQVARAESENALRELCEHSLARLKSSGVLRPEGVDALWRSFLAAPESPIWSRAFTLCVAGRYLESTGL